MIGAAEAVALLAELEMNDRKQTILLTLLIQKQIIGRSKRIVHNDLFSSSIVPKKMAVNKTPIIASMGSTKNRPRIVLLPVLDYWYNTTDKMIIHYYTIT